MAGFIATSGVAVTAGPAAAASSDVSGFYNCAHGPGSGSGWDDQGRTYLACGDRVLVYSEDGQLAESIAVSIEADDVAPSPNGDFIYVATGKTEPRRLDRRSDGSYALDATWRLASYSLYGASYAPTGRYVATDDAGDIFVADGAWGGNLTHTVVKYTAGGHFVTRFGEWQKTWNTGFFYWQLNGITVSRDGSHVYTVEGGNDRIQRWDLQADGTYEVGSVLGSNEADHGDRQGDNCNFNGWTGEFASSYDVGFDGAGYLYVLNTTCTEVDRFDPDGNFVESFDLRNPDSSLPHGFAVSRAGDVFVPQARRVIHTDGSPAADTIPPTVSVHPHPRIDGRLDSDGLRTTFTWAGLDRSGVAKYEVRLRSDAGDFVNVTPASLLSTTYTTRLAPGHRYQLAVRATDITGNLSDWSYGSRFRISVVQDRSSAISYQGRWTRRFTSHASGQTVTGSGSTGAVARLSFTGRDLVIVAPRGPRLGAAAVYVDGRRTARLDEYASVSVSRAVVLDLRLRSGGTHVVAVRPLGTAGRPRIEIDAVAVLG